MGFRTFVSMNIAVIGTGSLVENYAARYALAGHEVYIAWKGSDQKNTRSGLAAYDNIHVCSIEEAAESSDLIIIACEPKYVREVAYWMGDVRCKLIIDATANLRTEEDEGLKTVSAIHAITGSNQVVKVFTTRGYEQLLKPLFKDEKVRLVLAGDSKKAKEFVKILTRDLGVDLFFDLGGDDAIPLFNEMTRGWKQLMKRTNGSPNQVVAVIQK